MIIQKIIVPYFKQGDFETGIGLAINAILKELNYDQYLQDQKYVTVQKHVQKNQGLSLLPFFLLFLLYPIIRKIFRNRFLTGLASGGILAGANYYVLVGAAGSMAIGVAIIMFIIGFVFGLLGPLNAAMLAGRGGIYGGRSGGGFGGGGWSGGGGGFSGGGASGRW